MKREADLLSSFDNAWKEFSEAWKKARAKPSEKAVHDLRVCTRRLIATLEMARVVSGRNDVRQLQRDVKKILKRMGPLRDVQVQLQGVSQMRNVAIVDDLKRRLKRRERKAIETVHDELKHGSKRRLAAEFKEVRSHFSKSHNAMSGEAHRKSIEKNL
jgi:CHAD domain-containing protein